MFKKVSDEKVEPHVQQAMPTEARKPEMKIKNTPSTSSIRKNSSETVLSEEITVVGEIKGNSDVSICGKFEGNVSIPNNTATVELSGLAQATINANRVVVHGTVKGNLYGSDSVHVLSTGIVEGDIKAVNVILEKACSFNGSIQMLTDSPPSAQGKPAEKKMKADSSLSKEGKPFTLGSEQKTESSAG